MTLPATGQISIQDIITELNEATGESYSTNIALSGLIDGTYGDWEIFPDDAAPFFISDFYGLTAASV